MGLWRTMRRQLAYWTRPTPNVKPLASRMRASAVRKSIRFVLDSSFVFWCLNRATRLFASEMVLWVGVWWASTFLLFDGWPLSNFLLPCVVSGAAQLFLREPLAGAVGKHTEPCARALQKALRQHWNNPAMWVGLKSAGGLSAALLVIGASRAGLLEGPVVEISVIQIVLTMFVVDVLRNEDHPVRRLVVGRWEHYCGRPRVVVVARRRRRRRLLSPSSQREPGHMATPPEASPPVVFGGTTVQAQHFAAPAAGLDRPPRLVRTPSPSSSSTPSPQAAQIHVENILPPELQHYFSPPGSVGRWVKFGAEAAN